MKRIQMEVILTIDIDENVDPNQIQLWEQDVKLSYPTSKLFNISDHLPELFAKVVDIQHKIKGE